jgi:hypothetical protein
MSESFLQRQAEDAERRRAYVAKIAAQRLLAEQAFAAAHAAAAAAAPRANVPALVRRTSAWREAVEQRRLAGLAEKQLMELAECSFAPRLIARPPPPRRPQRAAVAASPPPPLQPPPQPPPQPPTAATPPPPAAAVRPHCALLRVTASLAAAPPAPRCRAASAAQRRSPLAPPLIAPSIPAARPSSDAALVAQGLDAAERLLHLAAQLAARTRRDLHAAASELERAAEAGRSPLVAAGGSGGGGGGGGAASLARPQGPLPRALAPEWASPPGAPPPSPSRARTREQARQRLTNSIRKLRDLAPGGGAFVGALG